MHLEIRTYKGHTIWLCESEPVGGHWVGRIFPPTGDEVYYTASHADKDRTEQAARELIDDRQTRLLPKAH